MCAVIACLVLQLALGAGQPVRDAAPPPVPLTHTNTPAQPASSAPVQVPQEPVGFGWG